ncbi:MAG TPA: protein kinase [Thermoanaerobaculia bacterium]|nr:protein kinase [Thermoanaerobaculia bacterium]
MSSSDAYEATQRLAEAARSHPVNARVAVPLNGLVGRYQIESLLGSGGMAEVYRAFDPALNRHVALKFLRDTDPEHLTRFMREARAQAQIGHPNICDVFDTGIVDGRPYIAMQCIEGATLAEAGRKMSVDEKAAVMVDVAEAVHAAHRTGLVHRDLTPGNIMVEAKSAGGWQPYVLDFGLARDQSMDTMTTIGMVMGTPPYMAPEQARADRAHIDRRTDVYSLGATMYDLFAGRPPFLADSSIGVMMKVVNEDAPPLRSINPAIPEDLETIVMKCLEKDQGRRYDSARALAEDLRRYLDGEPIEARPTTFVHRWFIRARKHPTIAALLAIASVAVLVSLGWAIATSIRSAERQRAAQRFGQEIERIEAVARYASMLPLHDLSREQRWIRARIDAIAREKADLGRTASAAADYAIGRGYLALHDYDRSRHALEAAWNGGHQTPEVAYALGRVIGAQYQDELQEAESLSTKDARMARRRQVEQQYRVPALNWLRRSAGGAGESPAYAEGLIALYEKRYDDALARARAAFAETPWMHEARKLEGDVWLARGTTDLGEGRSDSALAHFGKAGTAYGEAQAIAASEPSVLLGDAERWFYTMQVAVNRGEDPAPAMRNAIAAAERAAATNVNIDASLRVRASTLLRYADWQLSQGESPLDTLDRAAALARQATTINPKDGQAHSQLGIAMFTRGRYLAGNGENPIPLYDQSIAHHRRAVELDPRSANSLLSLGDALRRKADATVEAGGNPIPLVEEATRFYDRAIAADPKWANSYNNRALAFLTRGEWEMENGRDPNRSLDQAAASAERAIATNPEYAIAALNLGSAHLDRGNHHLRTGRDPRPAFAQAIDAYRRAASMNPKLAFTHSNTGLANLLSGQYALEIGENPHPWVERGAAAYVRALEINPKHSNSHAYSALLHLTDAQWATRTGADPTPSLTLARQRLARGIEIDPDNGDYLQYAAALEVEAARYAVRRGASPAALLSEAERWIARSMALNAANADTHYTTADVHRLRAQWLHSDAEITRALAAVNETLKLDARKAEAYALRGELLLLHGDAAAATRAFDEAVRLNPTSKKRIDAMRAASR